MLINRVDGDIVSLPVFWKFENAYRTEFESHIRIHGPLWSLVGVKMNTGRQADLVSTFVGSTKGSVDDSMRLHAPFQKIPCPSELRHRPSSPQG